MKKRELEIKLQQVPHPPNPIPSLEQYTTPATIAADVLYIAYQNNDIADKSIIDLGCGTGIFSVGAVLLGAKQIIGIDIDKASIQLARKYAKENNLTIDFQTKEIQKIQTRCDTVIMNPPFGAQKSNKNADRRFVEKGFEIAQIIYSLHLTKTISFIEKMISSLSGEITYHKEYIFPIKGMFMFHKKHVADVDVSLLRIVTNK